MNIPNPTHESYEKDFLKDINKQLEDIKQGFSDPLDGVLTYNNKGICTSFFAENQEITQEIILQKEAEIAEKIKKLDILSTQVQGEQLPPSLKKIYFNSIKLVKDKFAMFQHAIRLEASKGGYVVDEQTKAEKTNEVTKLQKTIYGPSISETPQERDIITKRLHEKYQKGANKLSEEEKTTYLNFLKSIEEKYGNTYTAIQEDEEQNTPKPEESEKEKGYKNEKPIDKEKLKEYSNKVLQLYKNYFTKNNQISPNRESTINPEKKSLYLSAKEQLEIPESYENISKEKLTKVVIGHEIEQHLLGRNNTNRLLGEGFMGNGYDLISEGVAKINEAIATGEVNSLNDLKKLQETAGLGSIGIFVCENENYEDSVEILRIYHKLGKRKEESECLKKAKDMVSRRKRFFAYNQPGSSIKDSLYDRGKNRVINFLTEDNDLQKAIDKYKDLNFGKLGKEEIELIPEIKKELGINDQQVLYTLMISRILNDKLIKGKGSAKEYTNPLNMQSIDFTTKRDLISILKDINSLESPS